MFASVKNKFVLFSVAVFMTVGGFLALMPQTASAVPYISNADDCFNKLGRSWINNSCSKVCDNSIAKPGYLVVSSPYDYCSNAASKISNSICAAKAGVFAFGVCLKDRNSTRLNSSHTDISRMPSSA